MSPSIRSSLIRVILVCLTLASCLPILPAADDLPLQTETREPILPSQAPAPTGTAAGLSPPGEAFTLMGLIPGESLPIYQDRSPDSQTTGAIPAGASSLRPTSDIITTAGKQWIQVEYAGQTGWVDYGYLAQQYGTLPDDLILLGLQVLSSLRDGQVQDLADLIHPDLCLGFSPYAYLHPDRQTFCGEELIQAAESDVTLLWGNFDGSGEPISLSFWDYYQKFIYDQDYLHAPIVGYNLEVSSGNSLNNIQEVYPDGMMIEYYYPGFDPQYGGMDWRSIRLVFVELGSRWFLTAIIHGEWTI